MSGKTPYMPLKNEPSMYDVDLSGNIEPQQATEESAEPQTETNKLFKYFDVDTDQVLKRLLYALLPNFRRNFLSDVMVPSVDLYGPFWICQTLIFIIAMSGNISNFVYNHGKDVDVWHNDFTTVVKAFCLVNICWLVGPVLALVCFRCSGRNQVNTASLEDGDAPVISLQTKFVEFLAVFGYSFTVLLPVSLLWMVQIEILQWILCLCAGAFSSGLVISTFWPEFSATNKRMATITMAVTTVFQFCFCILLMFIFYNTAPLFPPAVQTLDFSGQLNKTSV